MGNLGELVSTLVGLMINKHETSRSTTLRRLSELDKEDAQNSLEICEKAETGLRGIRNLTDDMASK